MASESTWFGRLDRRRLARGMSVEALCKSLTTTRTTYYEWKRDPERVPQSEATQKAIAAFLEEPFEALREEMQLSRSPHMVDFLRAAENRDLSVRLYRSHVQALGAALGMPPAPLAGRNTETSASSASGTSPPSRTGPALRGGDVEVALRLLRTRLLEEPDPIPATVAVRPVRRGRKGGGEWYQYQIYVIPDMLGGSPGGAGTEDLSATDVELLGQTRAKVDAVMDGTLLPVTREHSAELGLPLLADRADLLLYPLLLDMRAPDADPGEKSAADVVVADVVVIGVYYAGAPDVGALLADAMGHGFATFDQLARLSLATGLRGLPSKRMTAITSRIASQALSGEASVVGSMVWATDQAAAVLDILESALQRFRGSIVLLKLDESALRYAAHRLCRVDASTVEAADEDEWFHRLQEWQGELERLVSAKPSTVRVTIQLPAAVDWDPVHGYPDAVDAMFDQYRAAADDVLHQLQRGESSA